MVVKGRELSWQVAFALLPIIAVFAVSNTYFGMYVGMTIAASIPAAVIGGGVLRAFRMRGGILALNSLQVGGSAGESVAAGSIFVLPALVVLGLWTGFNWWDITCTVFLGGAWAVALSTFVRSTFVRMEELRFPEGVACAEVLRSSVDEDNSSFFLVMKGLGIGGIIKLCQSAFRVFADQVRGALPVGKGGFGMGFSLSPALLAVGYILKLNGAFLVFLGGFIAWVAIMLPYTMTVGLPDGVSLWDGVAGTWASTIRFVGVGTMIVAALYTAIRVIPGIVATVRAIRTSGFAQGHKAENDRDISPHVAGGLLGLLTIATGGFYYHVFGSFAAAVVLLLVTIISVVVFVPVASYIVGIVGSTNSPVSGMTIIIVIFAALVAYFVLGLRDKEAMEAVLLVGSVGCVACAVAADTMQDMKTTALVGATPWKQQLVQLGGVTFTATLIAPVLSMLHKAFVIGSEALPAPQVALFSSLAKKTFGDGGSLPVTMLVLGAGIGVAFVVADIVLRRRKSEYFAAPMAVAIGMYLPVSMAVPIFLGGLIAYFTARYFLYHQEAAGRAEHKGTLLASGLIAGEAIFGVVVAVMTIAGFKAPGAEMSGATTIMIIVFAAIAVWLYRTVCRGGEEA